MALTVEKDGPVLVATMDDGKANALTFDGVAELRDAVAEAVAASAPLVLAGRDGVFCAGFDLAVMKSGDTDRVMAILAQGRSLYRAIVEAPVPVITACTGHALAGGALLLMAADHRIGRPGPYKIGLNEIAIGMSLPEFALTLARHRLDPRHVTSAALFAEIATATRAAEIGFLDEVADDPLAAAKELATRLAGYSAPALALTKGRLRAPLASALAALPATDVEVLPTL